MKNTRMCIQVVLLAALLAVCLSLSFGLCSTETDKIEPTGTKIGAIQFDAVIESNRYSPRSLRHDYTLIFARYWVARDSYSMAVVWAEPQSTDMFSSASPGLSVSSDEHSFNVCHQTRTKSNEAHKKPLGEREVFRHMFGSYPIENIRFAEAEALKTRVYASDLGGLMDANHPCGKVLDVPLPSAEDPEAKTAAHLKVRANVGCIDSIELFDVQQHLLKSTRYEYESKEGSLCLSKMTAVLPERPMMVGFNGKGIKITLDGKQYQYRDLQATHHRGGRTCTVEYVPVKLGEMNVNLPIKVTVCNQKDGRILRRVRMMNFKNIELDATETKEAARLFGAFDVDYCKYQGLREKYWYKTSIEIEKKDVDAIKQLKVSFEKALDEADKNTGEKLKYLNALIELDRIVDDESEMERHYKNYLSTLSDNKLTQMILMGGYGVIETSMFRKRHGEAKKLLDLWVNPTLEINDAESILFFAKSQLVKNRLWTTAKLLESFSNKKHRSVDFRFEAEALRSIALGKLCKLMRSDDIAKKGFLAEMQANWVASIGKDKLDIMFTDSLNQAKRCFAELPEPTESLQALKKNLEEIEEEIIQANNEQHEQKSSI